MVGYMMNYFSTIGISPLIIFLLALIMLWDLIWKLLAMWKAARKNSPVWFVALLMFNTAGILPILYVYFFSECCNEKAKPRKIRRKRR
jgi:predicted permease